MRARWQALLFVWVFIVIPVALSAQKAKLPRPRALERGVILARDSATGELRVANPGEPSGSKLANEQPDATPLIRARVALVEAGCTVTEPDGAQVRGLLRDDFRVFEDGVEQKIVSFDAAATPASIVLVLDASPSISRELGEMRAAAQSLSRSLRPEDEVAVVAFANETILLLPFSRDRKLLAAALDSPSLERMASSSESLIYQAAYLTAHELLAGRAGRKAMVLLTDGQDSGLGLNWDPNSMQPQSGTASPLAFEDVARELAADGVELYVISTENRPAAMTAAWLAAHRDQVLVTPETRRMGMAQYTLYLAEMVRQVGGNLYFLHELGSLAEVYHRIALALSAEYTLGYYPQAGTTRQGWRALRVQINPAAERVPPGAQLTYRDSYYVPALP
jgi:Ca-activated chloride channel family protein